MQGAVRIFRRLLGMDERPDAREGAAERIENLTLDKLGIWRSAPSFGTYGQRGSAGIAAGTGRSLCWWAQRGAGRQWIVWERATSTASKSVALEAWRGSDNGDVITLATGRHNLRSIGLRSTYLPDGAWLRILNGYDNAVRWDGNDPSVNGRVVQCGFPVAATAPRVRISGSHYVGQTNKGEPDTGVGAANSAFKFGYAVTWVNDVGCESPTSDIVWVSGTNGAAGLRSMIYVSIPDAPAHVRTIRLYRTPNVDGVSALTGARVSLYFLQEFTSGSAQQWLDSCPDAYLGLELDESKLGCIPAGVRLQASFGGCWWLAGSPAYPERVFYSTPGFLEQFPADYYFDAGGVGGGEITGLATFKDSLVVFKRRGVFLIKQSVNTASGFEIRTLTSDTGCVAPHAIVEIPEVGLMFLSDDGPMILEGTLASESEPTNVKPLAPGMTLSWGVVDPQQLPNAVAARDARYQEVVLSLPGTDNNALWVYHYLHNEWSLRTEECASALSHIVSQDDQRGQLIGLMAAGGLTFTAEPASTPDGGTAWLYRTAWWGPKTTVANITRVELHGELSADFRESYGGLTFRGRANRALLIEKPIGSYSTPDIALPEPFNVSIAGTGALSGETEYSLDTYTTGVWDTNETAYWLRPAPRVFPIAWNGAGHELQFEFAQVGLGQGCVELSGLTFELSGGDADVKWALGEGVER